MKTALITGGNSGMGKAAALALAAKGYRVIIHGRDESKTQEAAEEIKKATGNNQVDHIAADISLLGGMKALANAVKQKTSSLESLVLSTGTILSERIITSDGLEKGFVVQYLSRFAVTQLLLPELIKGKAKIAMVGATVIPGARIHFDDITLKSNFSMVKAMAQEMFANHLFVQEFAKRHPENEVVMNMANVGVAKTGITRNMNFFVRLGVSIIGRPPENAARNTVFLSSDGSVNYSGYYLRNPDRNDKKQKINFDPDTAERLWEESMIMIKELL